MHGIKLSGSACLIKGNEENQIITFILFTIINDISATYKQTFVSQCLLNFAAFVLLSFTQNSFIGNEYM